MNLAQRLIITAYEDCFIDDNNQLNISARCCLIDTNGLRDHIAVPVPVVFTDNAATIESKIVDAVLIAGHTAGYTELTNNDVLMPPIMKG